MLWAYLIIDERGEREEVEQVGEVPPYVGVAVFAQTLVVEAVDLRNLPRLVVTSQDGDAVAIAQLESHEESDRFD